MKAEELFQEVKRLPIAEVISRRGVNLRKRGATYEGLCPFHNDSHVGSFKVNPNKNTWKCYACGVFGDASDFVSKIENISPIEAVIDLAAEFKLISQEEANELLNGKEIKKTRPAKTTAEIKPNKKRSTKHCEAVYDAFVKASPPLTKTHLEHLKEVRKIKEEDMKNFFEWPNSFDRSFWSNFEEELRCNGIYTSVTRAVQYVPGFAYDAEKSRPYFMSGKGIGIILRDGNGVIRGLQIRQDKVSVGVPRYKLFSSGWAETNEELTKMDGVSSKQVPDIVFPKGAPRGAAITEGKFKALAIANTFGLITLSVNGVYSWATILPEFLEVVKKNNLNKVSIFYDADMAEKPGVANAAISLSEAVEKEEFNSDFILWKEEYGKGIDDVILEGNISKLLRRPGSYVREALKKANH